MIMFFYCLIPQVVLFIILFGLSFSVNKWSHVKTLVPQRPINAGQENDYEKEIEQIKNGLIQLEERNSKNEEDIKNFIENNNDPKSLENELKNIVNSEEVKKMVFSEVDKFFKVKNKQWDEDKIFFKKDKKTLIKEFKKEGREIIQNHQEQVRQFLLEEKSRLTKLNTEIRSKWMDKVMSPTPLVSNFNSDRTIGLEEILLLKTNDVLCFRNLIGSTINEANKISVDEKKIENIVWFVLQDANKEYGWLFLNRYYLEILMNNNSNINNYSKLGYLKAFNIKQDDDDDDDINIKIKDREDVSYCIYPGLLKRSQTTDGIWEVKRAVELYSIPSITKELLKKAK